MMLQFSRTSPSPLRGGVRGGGAASRDFEMPDLRARALRNAMTEAERCLWNKLRERNRKGSHFRRQVPIGSYIVDFCWHKAKLIVEVDGGQHNEDAERMRDQQRTQWLESRGYRVIRFWN